MGKNKIFIFFIILLVTTIGFVFYLILNTQPKTNWQENFDTNKKNAFDLSIFSKEIETLLPNKIINKYDTDVNTYLDNYANPELTNQTILIIKPEVWLYNDNLINYIDSGNDVFIVSNNVSIENQNNIFYDVKTTDKIEFFNKLLEPYETMNQYNIEINSTDLSESFDSEVLGKVNDNNVFIRYKIGKGNLYIHNIPHVFTNHYLINNSVAYPSAVLSYIKQDEITFISNGLNPYTGYESPEDNEQKNEDKPSLLSFILSNKYLKSAWYLFVISFLIFILFRAKRVQRIIPKQTQNKNKTVEFIQTISSIYYNEKNNLVMVKKLNHQFLDKVEKLYNIKTENLDQDFMLKLASVTGVNAKIIEQVVAKIKLYNYSTLQPTRTDINEHYINLKKIIK